MLSSRNISENVEELSDCPIDDDDGFELTSIFWYIVDSKLEYFVHLPDNNMPTIPNDESDIATCTKILQGETLRTEIDYDSSIGIARPSSDLIDILESKDRMNLPNWSRYENFLLQLVPGPYANYEEDERVEVRICLFQIFANFVYQFCHI